MSSKVEDKYKVLKINKKLPQIILPNNKIDMFIEWYNKDIRFQETVPKAFQEGYLRIECGDKYKIDTSKYSTYIKNLARKLGTTYRVIENQLITFADALKDVMIHFIFTDSNVVMYLYGLDNKIISRIQFTTGPGANEPYIKKELTGEETWDEIQNDFNYFCLICLSTCMWYISTTTNTTKYYYEETRPITIHKHKDIRKVSSTKTITTPFYDMSKIRKVKVEHLIKRRKGWTYSHSFQVHGHYRHYRDGKVIFIEPYIKGKDKELQQQTITLNPKT